MVDVFLSFRLLSISFFSSYFSQKLSKTNQKTPNELYREAAQMLGMSCEFTENCRCLDCQVSERQEMSIKPDAKAFSSTYTQSRYFDCDDDDDSDTFSNLSAVIETEEFSTRVDNGETLYYCNGDDGYCNCDDGTCQDVENE